MYAVAAQIVVGQPFCSRACTAGDIVPVIDGNIVVAAIFDYDVAQAPDIRVDRIDRARPATAAAADSPAPVALGRSDQQYLRLGIMPAQIAHQCLDIGTECGVGYTPESLVGTETYHEKLR